METPKKVIVREEPEGPVYIYLWRDWGFILLVLFGLFFTAIPIWISLIAEDMISIGWLFILLFTAIGLGLTYWSLGRVINRSEIRLQNGSLSVRHKPLPWRYQADLPTDSILAVNQESYYTRSHSGHTTGGIGISIQSSIRNERLVAIVRTKKGTDKAIILIPKMELAAARFLEQEIETGLGLRQGLAPEEQEKALQFAQQEEKLVEAHQANAMIPLLMLMTALLIIVGIWLLFSTFIAQREANASLSWPSAVGLATGYTIYENQPDSNTGGQTYYDAAVEYTYLVEDKYYTIDQYLSETFSTGEEMAQFVETNYPADTPLTIYYNPQNPGRALIDRTGPGALTFVMAGVLVVCGLVTLALVLFIARHICQIEGCPDEWKHWPFWRAQVPFLGRAGA